MAVADRRQDAGRNPHADCEEHRPERQFQRRGKVLRQFDRDRLGVEHRGAEVAVSDRGQVEDQLHEPRPVEPQLAAQVSGFLRTGVFAQAQDHRVARDRMHEQKADHRNGDQNQNQSSQPIDEEPEHLPPPRSRRSRRSPPRKGHPFGGAKRLGVEALDAIELFLCASL